MNEYDFRQIRLLRLRFIHGKLKSPYKLNKRTLIISKLILLKGIIMKTVVKKVLPFLLVIILMLSLPGCGEKTAKTDENGYADQSAFLRDMAKGIQKRLAAIDDEKHANDTDEQKAEYYKALVKCELDQIAKYEDAVFEDSKFNDLAHHYIHACRIQYSGAENYKNTKLHNALWDGGSTVRSGIIVTMYEQYDLPIDSNTVSHYTNSNSGYVVSVSPSSSTSEIAEDKTPYSLGDVVTKSCSKGEAAISLDNVVLKGTIIQLTATNHGVIFFPNNLSNWTICYYDADGYLLQEASLFGANCDADILKPGSTVSNLTLDYSYSKYSDDIAFFSVDKYTFDGTGSKTLNTSIAFYYAFDKNGNQIDYYSLKR